MKEFKILMEGINPRIFVDGIEQKYVRYFKVEGSVEEITTVQLEHMMVDDKLKPR